MANPIPTSPLAQRLSSTYICLSHLITSSHPRANYGLPPQCSPTKHAIQSRALPSVLYAFFFLSLARPLVQIGAPAFVQHKYIGVPHATVTQLTLRRKVSLDYPLSSYKRAFQAFRSSDSLTSLWCRRSHLMEKSGIRVVGICSRRVDQGAVQGCYSVGDVATVTAS